ncbi:MAG TPA: putative quinol monooxygenase [Candidatus Acidoferrum sp.]|nr:putative quinol monooxygenase [Candidatus Acidoferrum sp.]
MSLYIFVRFDAKSGLLDQLREELLAILPPTRAESGCLDIHLYEEKSGSGTFFIHSIWQDDAALDAHAQLPHMKRFLALLGNIATNQVKAVRTHQIG